SRNLSLSRCFHDVQQTLTGHERSGRAAPGARVRPTQPGRCDRGAQRSTGPAQAGTVADGYSAGFAELRPPDASPGAQMDPTKRCPMCGSSVTEMSPRCPACGDGPHREPDGQKPRQIRDLHHFGWPARRPQGIRLRTLASLQIEIGGDRWTWIRTKISK